MNIERKNKQKSKKKKANSYFAKLFKKLCNDYEMGEPVIDIDGDVFRSPEALKDYMVATLTSNMQYDFGIDFTEKDVKKFAKALLESE